MSLRDCRSDVILGGKSNVHVWVRLRVNVDRAGGAEISHHSRNVGQLGSRGSKVDAS